MTPYEQYRTAAVWMTAGFFAGTVSYISFSHTLIRAAGFAAGWVVAILLLTILEQRKTRRSTNA